MNFHFSTSSDNLGPHILESFEFEVVPGALLLVRGVLGFDEFIGLQLGVCGSDVQPVSIHILFEIGELLVTRLHLMGGLLSELVRDQTVDWGAWPILLSISEVLAREGVPSGVGPGHIGLQVSVFLGSPKVLLSLCGYLLVFNSFLI